MSAHLDGRIAQAWGGVNPDGVHLNLVLAARGSATAAAMTAAFSGPAPGFTPILVCVGEDQPSYETVQPPTIMLPKTAPADDAAAALISGACQVGIAQGVLDAVAARHLAADQETVVFASVWLNPEARSGDAVRAAAREATGTGLAEAAGGRDADAVGLLVDARDSITHPFYRP